MFLSIRWFFSSKLQNLGNSEFRVMKDKILTLIHADAIFVKGCSSLSMQRCFAIKAEINALLDVTRQIYCELINDMKSINTYTYKYNKIIQKKLYIKIIQKNYIWRIRLNRNSAAISRETQASIILGIQRELGLPYKRCDTANYEHDNLGLAGGIYSGNLSPISFMEFNFNCNSNALFICRRERTGDPLRWPQ